MATNCTNIPYDFRWLLEHLQSIPVHLDISIITKLLFFGPDQLIVQHYLSTIVINDKILFQFVWGRTISSMLS